MSITTATLIAGSFALLGVVVERLLRLVGLLRFEASEEPSLILTGVPDKDAFPRSVPLAEADETTEADGVDYTFALDLFNGKEVPTGLRDIAVVLICADGTRFTSRPDDLDSGTTLPSPVPGTPRSTRPTTRSTCLTSRLGSSST